MDTVLEDIRNSIGIIPARLESSRLPRKLLLELAGKPVIQWTLEGASTSKFLQRIIVATDSDEIFDFCFKIGFEAIRTPSNFESGTERVFWAYHNLGEKFDFIVNIQGDEPFINGNDIDNLLLMTFRNKANISTLVAPITSERELIDPSTVKVVRRLDGFALYFSRSTIPFIRDVEPKDWLARHNYFKHIGIYCFRSNAIERINSFDKSNLEGLEKLEQLRWLDNGEEILCVETKQTLISIDTAEDLNLAEHYVKNKLSI